MIVAIVDYGSGNLRSAAKAFERAAEDGAPGTEVLVTDAPERIAAADRIVLPGVGAFADCRRGVLAVPGLMAVLQKAVVEERRPFLGICVGMELLADQGFEYGTHDGFGWIHGQVRRIEPGEARLKVPHMGWNRLALLAPQHPLLAGLPADPYAYFLHSYHFVAADPATVLARTEYGQPVTAVVARGNIAGMQFHPEKSQAVGLRLLANFLQWEP